MKRLEIVSVKIIALSLRFRASTSRYLARLQFRAAMRWWECAMKAAASRQYQDAARYLRHADDQLSLVKGSMEQAQQLEDEAARIAAH